MRRLSMPGYRIVASGTDNHVPLIDPFAEAIQALMREICAFRDAFSIVMHKFQADAEIFGSIGIALR